LAVIVIGTCCKPQKITWLHLSEQDSSSPLKKHVNQNFTLSSGNLFFGQQLQEIINYLFYLEVHDNYMPLTRLLE
jgi:hypothetical protein